MKSVSFLISAVFPFPSGFPSFQADLTLIRSEMASEADFPGSINFGVGGNQRLFFLSIKKET